MPSQRDTDVDLSAYPDHIQHSIRSEAETWRYGNVASARDSYEETREWAGRLTPEQRKYHASGYWYSNQLLHLAAVSAVQRELGDDPDCENRLN